MIKPRKGAPTCTSLRVPAFEQMGSRKTTIHPAEYLVIQLSSFPTPNACLYATLASLAFTALVHTELKDGIGILTENISAMALPKVK
jgi:hypothetical protein